MTPDPADHAYSHCSAVLLEPSLAEEAAREALRRGPRTITAVLAQARYLALSDMTRTEGTAGTVGTSADGRTTVGPVDLATAELSAVARQLTASRPPLERAIVDLHGRHGLDRLRFARTLGLQPSTAAARAAAVAETWAATLDPALLARLGPGDCEGLAAVLARGGILGEPTRDDPTADAGHTPDARSQAPGRGDETPPRPPVGLDSLLAAVPAVAGHVESCEACRDRLRAMISVADLVTRIPLETAPREVRVVVLPEGWRRRRLPASLPPPIEPEPGRRAGRRLIVASSVIGILAGVVAAGTAVAGHLSRDTKNDRVLALTKLPAANALSVDRATVFVPGGTFVLLNHSNRRLRWQADSPVAWLGIYPGSGALGPGGQARLRVQVQGNRPGSQAAVTVAITGDDGSATAVQATTDIAILPDVATSMQQCVVTATAEAPQGIADVVLHWRALPPPRRVGTGPGTNLKLVPRSMDPSAPPPSPLTPGPPAPTEEHILAMAKGDTGYTAEIPAQSVPVQWWVAAVDNGGAQVDTVIQILGPGSCS